MSGLREIAAAAGVSIATASRALRREPYVKKETAALVRRLAKQAGYKINPYAGQLMAAVRRKEGNAFRGNLALIWIDLSPRDVDYADMREIQAGAHRRAEELGYSLAEFKRTDYETKALAKVLKSRGVQGVCFSPSYLAGSKIHIRFPFQAFSCVALGWAIAYPSLCTVRLHKYQAVQLAMHQARHRFGKGISMISEYRALRRADHMERAAFLAFHPGGASLGEKLFLNSATLDRRKVSELFARHGVKCVIVQHEGLCPSWLDGLVPPQDRIYLERPASRRPFFGWTGHGHSLVGRWGVELLAGLVQRGELGVPEASQTLLAPLRWEAGIGSATFADRGS